MDLAQLQQLFLFGKIERIVWMGRKCNKAGQCKRDVLNRQKHLKKWRRTVNFSKQFLLYP